MATLATNNTRERKRKLCTKCGQYLSHAAYSRHLNPAVCPERLREVPCTVQPAVEDVDLMTILQPLQDADRDNVPCVSDLSSSEEDSDSDEESSDEESSDESESSVESDVPIMDEDELDDTNVSSESLPSEPASVHIEGKKSSSEGENQKIKVSDRGMSLLLGYLKCLVLWLCSLCSNGTNIRAFYEYLPSNVYFLRKLIKNNNQLTHYVVCPKCHSVYEYDDCIIKRNGKEESAKCEFKRFPNHRYRSQRTKICGTQLLKHVKCGSSYELVPRMVYVYKSIISSLTRLVNTPNFLQKCEHWRHIPRSPGMYTDVYDGKVWKDFMTVEEKPFLQLPNNLCLQLNVDWFTPYKHIKYSVGVIYLVIENLPRTERFKLENIIVVGCIPGPKEPSKTINSFLKPLIDELLILWKGTLLKTSSLFGILPIRCALTCVTCDLPATRKVCGFTSFSSLHGCSKCLKTFPGKVFGKKSDYSGYNRDTWPIRLHREHLEQVKLVENADTAKRKRKLEKKYGTRYSELLRLPYFDIVQHHVVDPMHNLLLGTAKHQITIWKDLGLLTEDNFVTIQQKLDDTKVPKGIGRIPHKINSGFSSFTADQWKNWSIIYSLYSLKGILPDQHLSCWGLFVEACLLLLKPAISYQDLNKADEKLIEYCKTFEQLYGKQHCTPNMHMQLHIRECVLNYGSVYAFWCFTFERFNGILESFQKNWIAPEVQMIRKFLAYQNILASDMHSVMPEEMQDFFKLHLGRHGEAAGSSEGSVDLSSQIDGLSVLQHRKNRSCLPQHIDATMNEKYLVSRRSEKLFKPTEVSFLSSVYKELYPEAQIGHVPMRHERFSEVNVTVYGQNYLSSTSKGKNSVAVCAYWAAVNSSLSATQDRLRVGVVEYFFNHTIATSSAAKSTHIFAYVRWYRTHPRESWFNYNSIVVSPDFEPSGPASIIPLSRVYSRCAIISDTVQFDYGLDKVIIATIADA